MKFSFLLPSKNRIELLARAIDSIFRQQYENFEIIVSDNASDQDYPKFLAGLNDSRLVYRRSPAPISVTENWNKALELASGDYVLMLGDDDALAPGFLPRMADLLVETGKPDIAYLAAYHYCYPNVSPWKPAGYLADVRNSEFFKDRTAPFTLPILQAQRVASAVFDFRYLFGFNSQHFLFRSGFLARIAESPIGSIFQSPYPDTFAAAVSFMKAESILAVPEPSVLIGISPKSFGYYYFNDLEIQGLEFLDNEQVSPDVREAMRENVLPGDRNNTNWLVAAEEARRALAPEHSLALNIDRYRMLQIVSCLRDVYQKKLRAVAEIEELAQRLTQSEQAALNAIQGAIESSSGVLGGNVKRMFRAIDGRLGQFWPAQVKMLRIGRHTSISDALRWLEKSQTRRSFKNRWFSGFGSPLS